ncbi:MAG TPA: glycosyltransferase family 2 protein [Gaiellaceae bacterium]|nr:glycosyltransferase family 2 protein [Gaiellaceae bacterium]
MSDDRPLVSVVTPVFNGGEHLAEAIESVLAQTYENWDYAICDNVSTDNTREVAEEYAHKDERIRLVTHDEHLGLLENWNRAIRLISPESKYAKVLHADDWFFPECFERMVALAEEHPSVGIVGAYRLEGDTVGLDGIPYTQPVVPGLELCRGRFLRETYPFVFGAPSSLMFRSDLVRKRDPFYDETNLHSDTGVCYDVLQESDFGFVHQVLTYTRRHTGAFTSYTQRVGTYKPLHLEHLLRYGPGCLTPHEFEDQVGRRVTKYARFLLLRAHRFSDPEFRTFHLEALARLRTELGLARMTGMAGRSTLVRVERRLRRSVPEAARRRLSGSGRSV